MFKSISKWCNYPIRLQRSSGRAASGDRLPPTYIDTSCYIAEETTVITDKLGKEYVSKTQLYTKPSPEAFDSDFVEYDGKSYEIRKLSKFREGSTQALDVQVIYL